MARFRKSIVKAGRFLVGTETGARVEADLPVSRLQKWVNNFNKMKSKGHLIPAPWRHDLNAVPVVMGNDGTLKSSADNAGFWDELAVEGDELVGYVDVPGDENDPNTPAGKVGTTVKETSIYARPAFLDGTGELYQDALMHIALVTHPIEPGQKNFEKVIGDQVIAMSHRVGDLMASGPKPLNKDLPIAGAPDASTDDNPDDSLESKVGDSDDTTDDMTADAQQITSGGDVVPQLLKALRHTNIGIDLPDDTNEENFLRDLLIAARQKAAEKSQSMLGQPKPKPQDLSKPPEGAAEQPTTIAMSTPSTTDTATLMSQLKAQQDTNALLVGHLTTTEKEKRNARVAALVASGRTTQAYADQHLKPMIDGFVMSLGADGKPAVQPVDQLLVALEALPARTGSTVDAKFGELMSQLPEDQQAAVATIMSAALPAGSVVHQPESGFYSNPNSISDEDATAVANQFLANVGR